MPPSVCRVTFRGDQGTAVVTKSFCSRSCGQGEGHTQRARMVCGKKGDTFLDLRGLGLGALETLLKEGYLAQ